MSKNQITPNGFSIIVPSKEKPYTGIFGKPVAAPLARAAFVNLGTPVGAPGQKPKYGLALLTPKNEGLHNKTLDQQKVHLKAIQDMCKLMAADFWGDKAGEMAAKIKRGIFGDGDRSSTGKVYEGYPGCHVINARNAYPNGHAQGWKLLNKGWVPEQIEGGMIVRCVVQPFLNNDGFSYSLRDLMVVHDDGVRFGGAPDSSHLIEELEGAAAAADANISGFGSVV